MYGIEMVFNFGKVDWLRDGYNGNALRFVSEQDASLYAKKVASTFYKLTVKKF